MTNCPSCSASVEPGSWFCPQCAVQLSGDDDIDPAPSAHAEPDASEKTRDTILDLPGIREITQTLAWAPPGRTFTGEALILGELDPSRPPEPKREAPLGAMLPTGYGRLSSYLLYSDSGPRPIAPTDVPALIADTRDAALTPYERYLTTYINGQRSLRELQEAALLTNDEVISALMVLMDRRIVRLSPAGTREPEGLASADVDSVDFSGNAAPRAPVIEVLPPGLDLSFELASPAGLKPPTDAPPLPMLSGRWLISSPESDAAPPVDAIPLPAVALKQIPAIEVDDLLPLPSPASASPPPKAEDLLPRRSTTPPPPLAKAEDRTPQRSTTPPPPLAKAPQAKAPSHATPNKSDATPPSAIHPARSPNSAAASSAAQRAKGGVYGAHLAASKKRALECEKAKELFAAAQRDRAGGQIMAARMNLKLAIAFDPENATYQEMFHALEQAEIEPVAMPMPENPAAARLYGEADAAEAQGDIDRAIRLLERALTTSQEAIILNRLGVILAVRKRDFSGASAHLEEAVKLAPDNSAYVQNLSKVLCALAVGKNGKEATKSGVMTRAAQLWDRLRKKSSD